MSLLRLHLGMTSWRSRRTLYGMIFWISYLRKRLKVLSHGRDDDIAHNKGPITGSMLRRLQEV
ncbi:hypothetical protein DEO72_LG7g728 [Vigna unguiculata]|uniref:Uncharacterized protein n=1 Tax=Vigna unguiculata TaxID=3917 RepID=A0A4D6MEM1_VIGUN|nr:hypothetical protein DEO72_LG7g728 [Vigna unguiculata]